MGFKFQSTFIILSLLVQSIFGKGYADCQDQERDVKTSCADIEHNQDDTDKWDYELELCRKAIDFIFSSSFVVDDEHCSYILYEMEMETGLYSCPQQPMNILHTVIEDCHAFEESKYIKKEKVMYDYVSNYNWEHVALGNLPWQIDTWGGASWHYADFIDSLYIEDYTGSLLDMYLMTIDFYDRPKVTSFQDNKIDISNCNFKPLPYSPGIYRLVASFYKDDHGEAICQEYKTMSDCNRNPSTPHCFEVRIFPDRIKYGDVNFDGYMDIFMPFANIGGGSMQLGYHWVYLTRTSSNQNIFKVIKPLKYKTDNKYNDLIIMINDIMSFNHKATSLSSDKTNNDFNNDYKINIKDLLIMIKVSNKN